MTLDTVDTCKICIIKIDENEFKAGRLKIFEKSWRSLTSDSQVLDIALHCHIEFYENMEPKRTELNRPMIFFKTR